MNSIFKQLNGGINDYTANAISCDLSQVLLRENVAESERPGLFIVHVYVDHARDLTDLLGTVSHTAQAQTRFTSPK